jgi:bifunctional pyridoxal-dependent enzyme with beta-cystathionase and maltose regulon repressor activities
MNRNLRCCCLLFPAIEEMKEELREMAPRKALGYKMKTNEIASKIANSTNRYHGRSLSQQMRFRHYGFFRFE